MCSHLLAFQRHGKKRSQKGRSGSPNSCRLEPNCHRVAGNGPLEA
jgi:hypothetical protein